MSIPITIALYFILWWTLLFAVLPWGVKSQHEAGDVTPGTDPGAPVKPMLLKKAIWTSAITAVAVAVIYVIMSNKMLTL